MPREEVFLATKMWPTDYGLESGMAAAKSSLRKLDTDYLGNELNLIFYLGDVSCILKPSLDIPRSLHDALAALSQLGGKRAVDAR